MLCFSTFTQIKCSINVGHNCCTCCDAIF